MLGLGTGVNKLSSAEAASIASRSGGYLLDTYSGAAAAYSLRQLSSSYSGNAVKVRRSSDNTETDIGFVGGELDTASLSSFAGAGDAFVVSWFDQSGNSNDATQTTTANQPQIVSSGAVIVENGKPAVQTTGAFLQLASALSGIVDAFTLAKETGTDTFSYLIKSSTDLSIRTLSRTYRFVTTNVGDWAATSASVYYNGSIPSSNPSSTIQALVYLGGGSRNFLQISSNFTGGGSQRDWEGNIQEIILYPSDQSSNRTNIESNINAFYSIY